MGMTERVRPQTTRSATARVPKVTITGKTYTLVGDWPRSQSSAQTAQTAVDLTIDVVCAVRVISLGVTMLFPAALIVARKINPRSSARYANFVSYAFEQTNGSGLV
jgi:hypothetical protein